MRAVTLFCRAALSSGECTLPKPVLQCLGGGSLHTCIKSNLFRGECSDTMHCSTAQGKISAPLLSAALKTWLTACIVSLQLHLWTSALPYKCAMTQQQCCAALLRGKCIPHCPVLLCNTGSQHALCHCNHTYGHLLFIQVCCDPTAML